MDHQEASGRIVLFTFGHVNSLELHSYQPSIEGEPHLRVTWFPVSIMEKPGGSLDHNLVL